MALTFRLQANPTKRIGKNYQHPDETKREEFTRKFRDEKNRRRVSLNKDEDRIKWLERKGEEIGFRLADVSVAPIPNVASVQQGMLKGWHPDSDKPMTFGSVVFEGVLQVTDVDKFQGALKTGIGTGKAYGFGLLSVAPAGARMGDSILYVSPYPICYEPRTFANQTKRRC